jgi:hypothetical protein
MDASRTVQPGATTPGDTAPAAPPWAILPNIALLPKISPLARMCQDRGLFTFHRVADHVLHLPYGRNSDRAALQRVLEEGRGTCATKHALLAALAGEHGVEMPLMLGIYEMNGVNTPAVAAVLRKAGLASLPEAHCYLAWGKTRIDLTGVGRATDETFLLEERIRPEQIGDYKVRRHREFLEQWRREQALAARWTLDALWDVRERCIAALAAPQQR